MSFERSVHEEQLRSCHRWTFNTPPAPNVLCVLDIVFNCYWLVSRRRVQIGKCICWMLASHWRSPTRKSWCMKMMFPRMWCCIFEQIESNASEEEKEETNVSRVDPLNWLKLGILFRSRQTYYSIRIHCHQCSRTSCVSLPDLLFVTSHFGLLLQTVILCISPQHQGLNCWTVFLNIQDGKLSLNVTGHFRFSLALIHNKASSA